MKKIKNIWFKIIERIKYWFFYRPIIRKMLKSKGVVNKTTLNRFTYTVYRNVLLNKRMMEIEKKNLSNFNFIDEQTTPKFTNRLREIFNSDEYDVTASITDIPYIDEINKNNENQNTTS